MKPAGRAARLTAALIDAVPFVALAAAAISETAPDPARTLAAAGVPAYLLLQAVLLTRRGQSVGKRALGLRIALVDGGGNGGFVANVLIRVLANGVLFLAPGYFLLDTLFIFRSDRRCLHDLLAGTVVVEGSSPAAEDLSP
jgi:uncharacterized RDD family membrane protein YckC